jgi:mono/diheme cytochrome c family protein
MLTRAAIIGGWIALVAGAAGLNPAVHAGAQSATPVTASAASAGSVLNRYCVSCHNQQLRTAGLVIDTGGLNSVAARAELWERVILKLRTGAMPPAGRPRPDAAGYEALASWLEQEIDRAAASAPNPGRRPALHRLNRAEYQNAVRDALALDGVDVDLLLPPDDSSYGFDNIADVLWISPSHLERYVAAARKISRQAIGDPDTPVTSDTYRMPLELAQDDRFEELPAGTRGGLLVRRDFPVDGEYRFSVELAGAIRTPDPHELEVTIDGERVHVFTVTGRRQPAADAPSMAGGGHQTRLRIKGGRRRIGVAFVKKTSAETEGLLQPFLRPANGVLGSQPALGSLTITGPFESVLAPETPSRQRIFICRPDDTAAQETLCATKILSALARRAYRRPILQSDLDLLLPFFAAGRAEAGFDRGIQRALERLLVSPSFLFRVERDPDSKVGRISDVELASRLSFFLWSSIPDDELLDLAIAGRLREPAALDRQVGRMLADSKAQALVANFAGQWLYLRNLAAAAPDRLLFPDFDEALRQALRRETELFFESVVRENRSVLDLLGADYTFVNERLARHYGIPHVYGSHFRRVTLADTNRRGLLGHGSILAVTSYSTRTSPVMRGKWILENLLGAPPPPPPPDIPALITQRASGEKLSMKEAMVQHRANPVCASCHAPMDPLGFAMEHFDAVGKWREASEAGTPIDSSGALPNGVTFEGAAGLRAVLQNQPEQFVRTVTQKLLTYGLGRGLEYYDAPAIRGIVRDAERDGYTMTSIIRAIVSSTPFQMRLRPTS